MSKRVYLDHAATTPCDKRVVEAMRPFWIEKFGNASSPYSEGGEARQAIERAREQVAGLIGAESEEIYFTSSGTESNNTIIKGVTHSNKARGKHVITSAIEHHCVINVAEFLKKQGYAVTYLPVDEFGIVSLKDVERAIRDDTTLMSVMHANNEIGTVQPIEEIGLLAREKGIFFHCDAVQTVGAIDVNVNNLGVDGLSLSAHKLYGPKGVGAMYIRKGKFLTPLLHGGEQESRMRASTENVPGIVGLGVAAEIASEERGESYKIKKLRDMLIEGIMEEIPDVKLNGHPSKRLPNNANLSFSYIEGESMVLHLNEAGIACSTGSACSAPDLKASHVLLATGLEHSMAHGSLRFSLGKNTTKEEINVVINKLPSIVEKLRAMSPLGVSK